MRCSFLTNHPANAHQVALLSQTFGLSGSALSILTGSNSPGSQSEVLHITNPGTFYVPSSCSSTEPQLFKQEAAFF